MPILMVVVALAMIAGENGTLSVDMNSLPPRRSMQAAADPTDCVGMWTPCTAGCGTTTFMITARATSGGAACDAEEGQTRQCQPGEGDCVASSADCVGAWSTCGADCGTRTFVVTAPAIGPEGRCEATDGEVAQCLPGQGRCPESNCTNDWNFRMIANSPYGWGDAMAAIAYCNGTFIAQGLTPVPGAQVTDFCLRGHGWSHALQVTVVGAQSALGIRWELLTQDGLIALTGGVGTTSVCNGGCIRLDGEGALGTTHVLHVLNYGNGGWNAQAIEVRGCDGSLIEAGFSAECHAACIGEDGDGSRDWLATPDCSTLLAAGVNCEFLFHGLHICGATCGMCPSSCSSVGVDVCLPPADGYHISVSEGLHPEQVEWSLTNASGHPVLHGGAPFDGIFGHCATCAVEGRVGIPFSSGNCPSTLDHGRRCTANCDIGLGTLPMRCLGGNIVSPSTCCPPGGAELLNGWEGPCSSCAAGFYDDDDDPSTLCATCPSGTYTATAGATSCHQGHCAAGSYMPPGSKRADNCESCLPGRRDDDNNHATPCVFCEAGKYQNQSSATECNACDAGTTTAVVPSVVVLMPVATPCPGNGWESISRRLDCELAAQALEIFLEVPALIETSNNFTASCFADPWLHFNPRGTPAGLCGIGSQNCHVLCQCVATWCEVNFGIVGEPKQSSLGMAVGVDSIAGCEACAPGQYDNDMYPGTQCVDCPAGTYTSESGSLVCSTCSAGTYAVVGAEECVLCEAGLYDHDNDAATECSHCAPGTYTGHGVAAVACTDANCSTGTYACPRVPRTLPNLNLSPHCAALSSCCPGSNRSHICDDEDCKNFADRGPSTGPCDDEWMLANCMQTCGVPGSRADAAHELCQSVESSSAATSCESCSNGKVDHDENPATPCVVCEDDPSGALGSIIAIESYDGVEVRAGLKCNDAMSLARGNCDLDLGNLGLAGITLAGTLLRHVCPLSCSVCTAVHEERQCLDDPTGSLAKIGTNCSVVAGPGQDCSATIEVIGWQQGTTVRQLCPITCGDCIAPLLPAPLECVDDPDGLVAAAIERGFAEPPEGFCEHYLTDEWTGRLSCDHDMNRFYSDLQTEPGRPSYEAEELVFPPGSYIRRICPSQCGTCPEPVECKTPCKYWNETADSFVGTTASDVFRGQCAYESLTPGHQNWRAGACRIADEATCRADCDADRRCTAYKVGNDVALEQTGFNCCLQYCLAPESQYDMSLAKSCFTPPTLPCIDDPDAILAELGADCPALASSLGCDTDLYELGAPVPEGSVLSVFCPVACDTCPDPPTAVCTASPATCSNWIEGTLRPSDLPPGLRFEAYPCPPSGCISLSAIEGLWDDMEPLVVHTALNNAVFYSSKRAFVEEIPGFAATHAYYMRWQGQINLQTPGDYEFALACDAGCMLYIDQQLVVNNDGPHTLVQVEHGSLLNAEVGFHDISVTFFEDRGSAMLEASWRHGDAEFVPLAVDVLVPPAGSIDATAWTTWAQTSCAGDVAICNTPSSCRLTIPACGDLDVSICNTEATVVAPAPVNGADLARSKLSLRTSVASALGVPIASVVMKEWAGIIASLVIVPTTAGDVIPLKTLSDLDIEGMEFVVTSGLTCDDHPLANCNTFKMFGGCDMEMADSYVPHLGGQLRDHCPVTCGWCSEWLARRVMECKSCPHSPQCVQTEITSVVEPCRFQIRDAPLPWQEAEAECVAAGGHLASIYPSSAQSIGELLPLVGGLWIGYHRNESGGRFEWTDEPYAVKHPLGCKCASVGVVDDRYDGAYGADCTSKFAGRPFCFTIAGECPDGAASSILPGYEWSYVACSEGIDLGTPVDLTDASADIQFPENCEDDLDQRLAARGTMCNHLLYQLGASCHDDLHSIDPEYWEAGSTVSAVCPASCNACPKAFGCAAIERIEPGGSHRMQLSFDDCSTPHAFVCEVCTGAARAPEENPTVEQWNLFRWAGYSKQNVCPDHTSCNDDFLGLLRLLMGGPYLEHDRGWHGQSNFGTASEAAVTSSELCTAIIDLEGFDCSTDLSKWARDAPPGLLLHDLCPHTCGAVCSENCLGRPGCIPCGWIPSRGHCSADARCYPHPPVQRTSTLDQCTEHWDLYRPAATESPFLWVQSHVNRSHDGCVDATIEAPIGVNSAISCAAVAVACACDDVPGAADACCQSCPARANPLNPRCDCRDDDEWARVRFRDVGKPTCALVAATGWCNFNSSVFQYELQSTGELISRRCCKSCRVSAQQITSPCPSDETATQLAVKLRTDVGFDAVEGAKSTFKLDSDLRCDSFYSDGLCGESIKRIYTEFRSNRQFGPSLGPVQEACPVEAQECWETPGCTEALLRSIEWNAPQEAAVPDISFNCQFILYLFPFYGWDCDTEVDEEYKPWFWPDNAAKLSDVCPLTCGAHTNDWPCHASVAADAAICDELELDRGDRFTRIYGGYCDSVPSYEPPGQLANNANPHDVPDMFTEGWCFPGERGTAEECAEWFHTECTPEFCESHGRKYIDTGTGVAGCALYVDEAGGPPPRYKQFQCIGWMFRVFWWPVNEPPDRALPYRGQTVAEVCPNVCGTCRRTGVCVDDPWGFFLGWPATFSGADSCQQMPKLGATLPDDCPLLLGDVRPVFNSLGGANVNITNYCPATCGRCPCEDGWTWDASRGECVALDNAPAKVAKALGCLHRSGIIDWHSASGMWLSTQPLAPISPDQYPCRQTCTACDLGVICQSLLLQPMQQWTAKDALNWLIDETAIGTFPVVAAFVSGAVDGRALSVLVGPNDVLAKQTLESMNIPLASTKPLLEAVERYAYPTALDSPPTRESCSRLEQPSTVQQSIAVSDVYKVDDVAMEFEVALQIQTVWNDDRVLYIPESTDSELELCKRICLDRSTSVVATARVPMETKRCCDKMWLPLVSYTNAKDLQPTREPNVVWHDQVATMNTFLRGTFKSSMSFGEFPFDHQLLKLEMQLAHSAREATLEIAAARTTDTGCPGWLVTQDGISWTTANQVANGGGIEYSTATVQFEVQRLHSHFVDNYMTSMVMLCTLSWVSFALKDTYIEARLASTITLVLAMMALSQVITPSLPQSGEQTPAHLFMFRSNLFIVLVGIESILVNALGNDHHRLTRTNGSGLETKAGEHSRSAAAVDFSVDEEPSSTATEDPDTSSASQDDLGVFENATTEATPISSRATEAVKLCTRWHDLGGLIDVCATIVFPLSYVQMTRSTFSQLPIWSFAVYFPLSFGAILLLAQVIMGWKTLYSSSALQMCAPKANDVRALDMASFGRPYSAVRGPSARAVATGESKEFGNPILDTGVDDTLANVAKYD